MTSTTDFVTTHSSPSLPVTDVVLTWKQLTAIEPRLLNLERWASHQRFSWRVYEEMKAQLRVLAGWDARHPQLGTSLAWDVAMRHLLAILERRPTEGRRP